MLPKRARLVSGDAHRLVARRGRRARRGPLVVNLLSSVSDTSARVAVVVPKRVGNAVERNRVQRQLRHLFAERLDSLPVPSWTVVRAEPGSAGLDSATLAWHLDAALGKLGLTAPTLRQA